MADTTDVKTDEPVLKLGGAYKESDEHVPNPTDVYGTLDTSDTSGNADSSVGEVSPVFKAARAQSLARAALALDPEHPEVPQSLVVLPETQMTRDEAKEHLLAEAAHVTEEKVEVSDESSPAKEEAAETDEDTEGRKTAGVEAQQQTQGAGSLGGARANQTVGTSPEARTSASGEESPKVGASEAKVGSAQRRQEAQSKTGDKK